MEKFKICPICGKKNAPNMVECVECETDLTGVPVGVQEATLAVDSPEEVATSTAGNSMVRICECGERNAPSARKCKKCGEDISDIIPVTVEQDDLEEQTTHFSLSSLDGEYAYQLVENRTVVGREYSMREYLSSKEYVSRKHAEFLIEANKLWIKNFSKTNYTYINNERIADDEYVELHDGDIVSLGGKEINGSQQQKAAYFCVRIGECM